jgi:exo-1,4-beta-D-glucosaminidase
LEVKENQTLHDQQKTTFGIRKIETYLNPKGVRGYKVNGKPVLIKGAGWVDDLFLRYQPEKDSAQIRYVKEMNLNALRFEGVWGNSQHIYDLCDRNGILLMVGWSCQWEWPDYLGLPLNMKPGDENLPINEGVDLYAVKLTPDEETLLSDYFRDQVKWLRNHPSIFTWAGGSDAMPTPTLEKRYRQTLAEHDPTRPFLISTGDFTSTISGKSGMKMNGPYEYVPPVYWYEDKKLGGAFGFNSETGPGPQIPPVSSIKKMIPAAKLWPADNDVWNYHSGRKDFNTLGVYLNALNQRYGASQNLDQLTLKAQLMNYETIRPMFEAHTVNRGSATGVIQWMLNSPWPEFYWQLFDYYLMPTGAYYGTKKACAPLNAIYNYHDNLIYFANDTPKDVKGVMAEVKLLDRDSRVVWEYTDTYDLPGNSTSGKKTQKIPTDSPVYFLDLKLKDKSGKLLADNFYWLASKPDQLDWNRYFWYYTPQKQFADFTALDKLPAVKLKTEKTLGEKNGQHEITVRLSNPTDKVAFFVELEVQDEKSGEAVTPVFWSDNYVSLLPGETKTLTVRCKKRQRFVPKVMMRGMNVAKVATL